MPPRSDIEGHFSKAGLGARLWYTGAMNWLFSVFNYPKPNLRDDRVDCDACQVRAPLERVEAYSAQTKCCEFSPFVSAFAVGAWIADGGDLKGLMERAPSVVMTKLGLIHNQGHRASAADLCQFFDSENRQCKIWQHRPATCMTFFCASKFKKTFLNELENQWMWLETDLLKRWYDEQGGDGELWAQWVEALEDQPQQSIPADFILESLADVETLYSESWAWAQKKASPASLM